MQWKSIFIKSLGFLLFKFEKHLLHIFNVKVKVVLSELKEKLFYEKFYLWRNFKWLENILSVI